MSRLDSSMWRDEARGADGRAPLAGGLEAVNCADQQPGDNQGLSDRLVRIVISKSLAAVDALPIG